MGIQFEQMKMPLVFWPIETATRDALDSVPEGAIIFNIDTGRNE